MKTQQLRRPSRERAKVLRLPRVPPAAGVSYHIWLPRAYYVRVLSNDYSVDPAAIGRIVDIKADLHRRRHCKAA